MWSNRRSSIIDNGSTQRDNSRRILDEIMEWCILVGKSSLIFVLEEVLITYGQTLAFNCWAQWVRGQILSRFLILKMEFIFNTQAYRNKKIFNILLTLFWIQWFYSFSY